MQSLIQELKRDLPKEKLQILNLLITQLEIYDEQLRKVRTETNYQDQMRLIDEMLEGDKAA